MTALRSLARALPVWPRSARRPKHRGELPARNRRDPGIDTVPLDELMGGGR